MEVHAKKQKEKVRGGGLGSLGTSILQEKHGPKEQK